MRFWAKLAGVAFMAIVAGAISADDKKSDDDKKFTDTKFVDTVSSSGRVEVAVAKIAQVRAANPEVRKFAAKLEEDHTKANNDFLIIVSDNRIPVPESPLPEHEKMLMHFHGDSIKDFDKEYVKQMIESHEKSVKLFTQASKEAKNEQLKKFAEKTLPVIKEHLEMAKKLNDKVGK
jgi:putative membrane protein